MSSYADIYASIFDSMDGGQTPPPTAAPSTGAALPFKSATPSITTQEPVFGHYVAPDELAQMNTAAPFASEPAPVPFSSIGSQTRQDELPPSAPPAEPTNPIFAAIGGAWDLAGKAGNVINNTPVLGAIVKKGEEALQGWNEHVAEPLGGLTEIALQSAVAQIPGGERADIFSQGGTTKEELTDLLTRQDPIDQIGGTIARLEQIGKTKYDAAAAENPLTGLITVATDPLNLVPGAGIGEAQKFRQAAGAIVDVTKVDDALKAAPFLSKVFDFFSPLVRAGEKELVGLDKLGLAKDTPLVKRALNPLTAFQNTPRAKAINYVQKVHDWILPQAAAEGLTRGDMVRLLDAASTAARKGEITPELAKIISDKGITNSADFQKAVNGALDFQRPPTLDQTYVRAHELRMGIEDWMQGARPSIENLRAVLLKSEPWVDAFNDLGANYRGAYQRFAKTLDAYEAGKAGTGINEVRAAARQLNSDIETIGKLELASEFVDHSARVAQQFTGLPTDASLSQQIMNKIKAYESALLLAPNPHYVAQNIVSDWVRLAMFGVNPMEATEDLGKLFNRAYGTSDFKSILGDVADILKQADVNYQPNAAFGGNLPNTIRNLPGIKQLNDFNQVMNDRSKIRAMATGFRRAYKSAWKYGVDIPELPEQLANAIRAQGGERALKSVIKQLEGSFNAQEMRDALKTPFPMWQAYADAASPALDALFAKHGINIKTTPDMLEYLISHGTGEYVNETLANVMRRAQTEGTDFFGRIWDEEARKVQTRHADFKAGQAEWERQTFGRDFAAATPEEAAQRAKEAADKARVPGATDVPQTGVPTMITRDMERRLGLLGYDDAAIRTMKPQEAQDILRGGKKFTPPTVEPPAPPPIPDSPDLAAQLRSQEQGLLNRTSNPTASDIQAHTHSLEDVISGRVPVGVEGRAGQDFIDAQSAGLYTTTVGKTKIFARTAEDAAPLVEYLNSGGKYGTPEFSKLLGYSDPEISQYKDFLRGQSGIGSTENVMDAARQSRFRRVLPPPPDASTGVDDIRRYVTENPALNVVDKGAWDNLLTFKNADGTPRYTAAELATWRPHTIEEVAIRNGYASSTYNDFLKLFEKKTGKDAAKTGDYYKNLLNAEIKRKGYYDPDLADMQPFTSWDDIRNRPHDAYRLLRDYNAYPTLQEGEFKLQLRFKMIDDGIPAELQDGIEAIYDALGNTAAKKAGVSVDEWWMRNMGGVEGAPSTHGLRDLKQVQDTPELRRWFGESKVVDGEGKPLVVYHGTEANFQEFDKAKIGTNQERGGFGFFFSDQPSEAGVYGNTTMPLHLKIENPLVEFTDGTSPVEAWEWRKSTRIKEAIDGGHDGIILDDGTKKMFIVFEPSQIKSAIGNRGTFDPTNPNILMQGAKGATDFLPDGRRLMRFFKGEADASTYLHEAGHVFLPTLDAADMDEVARWTGLDSGETLRDLHNRWVSQDAALGNLPGGKRAPYQFREMSAAKSDAERYVIAQEKFARGFEKYLAEGTAPTEGLARVFEQFKDFMLEVYRGITGSDIDVKLTDEMRALYGRMLDADQAISPQELRKIEQGAVREARASTGAPHLAAGFFDGFFQHGIPESKKIWQYTKATEGMPQWWYPISNGRNIGTVPGGAKRMPPFVSAVGPNKAQLHGTLKKDWKLVNGSDNPEWSDFVLEAYSQATGQELNTIDDLLALVEDNIAHNSPLRTLEQRGVKKVKGQLDMFADTGRVDDMPLFSGTAQTAKDSAFVPQEVAQQGTMFDMRPQFGGEQQAATPPIAEVPSAPKNLADDSFEQELERLRARRAEQQKATDAIISVHQRRYGDLPITLTKDNGGLQGRTIAKSTEFPDKWQSTIFDERGLMGHGVFDTVNDAVLEAQKEGFKTLRTPEWSDKFFTSDAFAKGQANTDATQKAFLARANEAESLPSQPPVPNDAGQFSLFQDVAARLKDPTASTDPNLKADVEAAMAEELLKILKPYMEADIQNYGRALDPVTNELIEQFIHQAEPRMTEAKQVGNTMGRWYQQHTTMDYSQRWNVDDAMSLYAPFTFYPLHMAALLGQDFLDKPALFAMYTKMQREVDKQSEGLPARFAHRLKIPMPFLPDWMGDGMFFDPFATMFPVRQVFNLDDLERATFASQNGEPMDNASLIQDMYSPHLPWKLGKALLMGDGAEVQDTIANLPPMRMAKAWGAPYDVNIAGTKPLQGKWDNFYLQRAARDLVADQSITDKDMRIAMLTQKGATWDKIVERSRLQNYTAPVMSGWSGFTGKVYPAGELKYNETRMQQDQLKEELLTKHGANPNLDDQQAYEFLKAKGEYAEGGQMRAFLDAHPELDGAAAFNDKDEIYRSYLTDGIWEKLKTGGSLQNRLWRAQLGDDFDQLFTQGKTKEDYAAVPMQKLLGWANALKITMPQVTPDLQATPEPYSVTFPTAAQTQAYQGMQDEIKNTIGWDKYQELSKYQRELRAKDKDAANAWLKTPEGKQLAAVWDAQDEFYKANPDVLKLLEQAGVLEKKANTQTQAAPGTVDAQKQAWNSALVAIGYTNYDEYTAERDAYYALPQGSQARRDYIVKFPRLARMFAASRSIYGDDNKASGTGTGTSTGSSYSSKPYNWEYRPKDTYFGKTYGKPKRNPRLYVSYGQIFRQMGGTQQRPTFQRYKYEPYQKFPRRIMPRQ